MEEFNDFCVSSMKIKSLWFGKKKDEVSKYKLIDEEEGLNLYLQLFRFRYHRIVHEDSHLDYQYHVFRITLAELAQFTKVNKSRKLTYRELANLLDLLEDNNIIKNHTVSDWGKFDFKRDKHKLIVIEATDIPATKRVDGKDEPVNRAEDIYISVNFKTVNYMYDDLKLTSRELSLYLLLLRLSNNGESKAWAKIETMSEWLNTSKNKVSEMLTILNENGLIATYVRNNGNKGVKFEHAVLRSYGAINEFKKTHKLAIDKYLKRKGKI